MRSLFVAGAAVAITIAGLPGVHAQDGTPQPRLQSGALPGGGKFTLPKVGKPPFPVPTRTSAVGSAKRLTTAVDRYPSYVPQSTCDPKERAGITAFKKLLLAKYPYTSDWGSVRNCTDDGISEHLEGRAFDWHADSRNAKSFAAAANVLTWLTANNGYWAKRLGIMYIGYNHRIWAGYRASEGWRKLNGNPHTDHVHFSFSWNGAYKRTSYWTGKATSEDYGPCRIYSGQPAPLYTKKNTRGCAAPKALPKKWKGAKLLWRGSTGSNVKRVQAKLKIAQSGSYNAATQNAVAKWQSAHRIPRTGAVDAQTWFALGMNKK